MKITKNIKDWVDQKKANRRQSLQKDTDIRIWRAGVWAETRPEPSYRSSSYSTFTRSSSTQSHATMSDHASQTDAYLKLR